MTGNDLTTCQVSDFFVGALNIRIDSNGQSFGTHNN